MQFPVDYSFKLVSFDVTSLFTNVPIAPLLEFFRHKFKDHVFPVDMDQLIDLIKLCVMDCKFQFNGSFYNMKTGLAMGNPLSPVLANIYMEYFESVLLRGAFNRKLIWFRYIDDIICLWPDLEDLNRFFNIINGLVPSIKFTMEMEVDGCIPFLDVLIHRCENNFKFEVYRKPTSNDSFIHYYSDHHASVKQSVFLSMFLRALRVVSPEYFDIEINKILNIGTKLCYPSDFLDSCYKKAKKSFYRIESPPKLSFKNVLLLPFHTNFLHLKKLLNQLDINVIFSYKNTVRNILIKHSPKAIVGCVYNIGCMECDLVYVGQTGKELKVRIGQHKQNCRALKMNNAMFNHMFNFNHRIDWANAKTIVKNRDMCERNILESASINSGSRMNMRTGMYNIDCLMNNFLLAKYPKLK